MNNDSVDYKSVNKITTLQDFINKIMNIPEEKLTDKTRTYSYAFRGHPDESYEIIPSIGRNREGITDKTILNFEEQLIYDTKCNLPNLFKNDMEPIDVLATLQHLGIPTRLLDITTNPLVALYFACNQNNDKDGEVIIFKYDRKKAVNYPIINAIAETYKFANGSLTCLETFYDDVIEQPYFIRQKRQFLALDKDGNNKDEGENKRKRKHIIDVCESPLFIYSSLILLRQKLQSGMYILFPNEIVEEKYFGNNILKIEKNNECIQEIIKIDKESKVNILNQLSKVGITKGFLFNDSPDIVSKQIKEYYESL